MDEVGVRKAMDKAKLSIMRQDGAGTTEISKELGIGRTMVYKISKEESSL
jgi:hypothetical protein